MEEEEDERKRARTYTLEIEGARERERAREGLEFAAERVTRGNHACTFGVGDEQEGGVTDDVF